MFRVGDEREVAVGQLHHERKQYEDQLLQLVNQQEQILKEREGGYCTVTTAVPSREGLLIYIYYYS